MPPKDLDLHRCRSILLTCDEFQSNDSLRAVFSTRGLNAYRYQVPEANSTELRVDLCLDFLLHRSWKGKSLLLLFLEALCLRYQEGDERRTSLDRLTRDVSVALNRLDPQTIALVSPTARIAPLPATHEESSYYTQTSVATPALSLTDIGIVIALKEEFTELYEKIEKQCLPVHDPETSNYYYRFEYPDTAFNHRYRCVAMCVGEMGAVKANLATERLISKWNPSTIIMLGIAAALSDDISLGDVVIANQVDAYLENAKAIQTEGRDGYTFALSGEMYRSSTDLLQAIRSFEFVQRKLFVGWQKQCKQELQRLLPKERLKKMISSGLVRNQAKMMDGHLASGPVVGTSQFFIDWLKKRDRRYLALEMEAAGLMAAVHEHAHPKKTMIIRAISDYGDERKTALDREGEGAFRRYAIRNAIHLLWCFLDAGFFSYSE